MLVRELMSTPVETVETDATLETAAGRMLERGVGSLVVLAGEGDGESPTGILTGTDVLRAGHESGEPLSAIPVDDAASSPLVTVDPDRTVGHAVDRMVDAEVKHLPVVDGLEVVGILTLTDVALNYDVIRDEAFDLVGQRREWDAGE